MKTNLFWDTGKMLVALYEEHDKPPIAIEFVRKALGGPTVAEFEQLTNEKNEIVAKFDALCVEHEEACRKLNELLPPPPPPEVPPEGEVSPPEGIQAAAPPPTPMPPATAKQSGAAPAVAAKPPAAGPPAPAKSEKPAKSTKA
ncbi:hypothetical protein R1flu_028061 [Riccia fluitans]|uniref:Uncharacterized protein n=1 Tax=Riccia fluitans TaxID=41844 RepID=A0ABD1XKL6_9MARC